LTPVSAMFTLAASMSSQKPAPEQRYAEVVDAFRGTPGVTVGSGKKGFGSSAVQIHGKIFAMLSSQGGFVVKIPRQRVDALIAAGRGERFDPGHGRIMKEWLALAPDSEEDWLALAREALEHVASKAS
jgi:hypothetical protein